MIIRLTILWTSFTGSSNISDSLSRLQTHTHHPHITHTDPQGDSLPQGVICLTEGEDECPK